MFFAALERDRETVYRLMMVAPVNRAKALAADFDRTLSSFTPLTAKEAARVRPLRLDIKRARGNESISRLARSLPYGRANPDWFRVLNDLGPDDRPRKGQALKIVTT